jgi:Cu+-exporting ATPase
MASKDPVWDTEVIWTCPMHPQVQRAGPGSCPICGMALEPMTPAGGDAANPELRNMTRRFWVCVGLSVPLVALAMAEDFANPGLIAPRAAVWVQLVLATPAVLWGGWPFFERGWRSIVSRRLNMFTLIALGTGVAYVYSLIEALMPGIFPPSFRGPEAALFRGCGGHRYPGAARPSSRIAGPFANQQRHPRAVGSRAKTRPTRGR